MRLFSANNLDLQVARSDARAALGAARQAGAFPNPIIGGTHEDLSGGAGDASESYLTLSQRLEWPGTRGARARAALEQADAARARLAADSARLAFQVKEVYVRAAEAARAEAVLSQVTEVFREGARNAAARFADGDLSLYDRRRIEVEWARYETRLAEAALEAAAARRELALLVLPEGESREVAPSEDLAGRPPSMTLEEATATALERRRELEAARAASRAAEAEFALARNQRLPDVTATGGYKHQSDGRDGVFLGLSVPLPVWDRNGGAVLASQARQAAAASRTALVQRQVRNDVERAVETYRSLVRRADMLSVGVPGGAQDLLEIARVGYAEGDMELLQLLDAARAHLDARLAEGRLQADLWTSYYDLERAVGGFGDAESNGENDR
ncbi:MAG: TolC family protein [Longimicrobiales bacterium]|nr:TolC family protein [Longimicrobiales bacterium]